MHKTLLAIMLAVLLTGCGPRPESNVDLRAMLPRDVFEIQIFAIPQNATTEFVSPEDLEKKHIVKVEIRQPAFTKGFIRDLDEALKDSKCDGRGGRPDVRTGVVVWGFYGKKLRAFYYGKYGESGQVDDRSCRLTKGLYRWAQRQLPRDLEGLSN